MYGNQNTGMQWNFLSTLLVVGLAFALGLLVSNAELLQPAKTQQTIENLKLENERARIALEKEAERQQLLTEQAIEEAKRTSEKWDNLLQTLFNTVNTSLIILAVAIGIAIVTRAVSNSLIEHRRTTHIVKARHQPSEQAKIAREIERFSRSNNPIEQLYTRPFIDSDD